MKAAVKRFRLNPRTFFLWSLFFALVAAVYYFARDAYYIGFFNDDAHYILGARSLLLRGSYDELFSPQQAHNVQYFPGYPMLLAAWTSVFSESPQSLRAISVLFSLCLIVIAVAYARDKLQSKSLAGFGFLLAFNSLNLSLAGSVLSDIPFTLCLMSLLLVYDRTAKTGGALMPGLVGLLGGCLVLIRPLGALIVFAVLADLCLKRNWKKGVALASSTAFVVLVGMQWHVSIKEMFLAKLSELFATHESAGTGILPLMRHVYGNGTRYLFDMFSFVTFRPPAQWFGTGLRSFFTVFLSILFALGLIDSMKKSRVVFFSLLLYMAVIATWPVYATRYLVPVIPLFLFCLFRGLERCAETVPRIRSVVPIVGALGALLCLPPAVQILHASIYKDTVMAKAPGEVFDWIRTHTPEGAVFLTINEAELYWNTERYAVTLRRYKDSADLVKEARRQKIDYILSQSSDFLLKSAAANTARDPLPQETLDGLIRNSKSFALVFQSQDKKYAIYQLH